MTFHSVWPAIPVGPRSSGRFNLQCVGIVSSFELSDVDLHEGPPPQRWMRGLPTGDRDVMNVKVTDSKHFGTAYHEFI